MERTPPQGDTETGMHDESPKHNCAAQHGRKPCPDRSAAEARTEQFARRVERGLRNGRVSR